MRWSWRRGGDGVQDGAIFLDGYPVVRLDFELSPITDSRDGIEGMARFIVDALNEKERTKSDDTSHAGKFDSVVK